MPRTTDKPDDAGELEPHREEPFEQPGQAPASVGGTLECPECGETFDGMTAKMRLGGHRKREHGVVGANAHKKGRGAGSSPGRQSPRSPRPKGFDYEGTMLAWHKMAGQMWAIRDPQCGAILADVVAPTAAKQWAELARTHEGVRRFIEQGASTGGWMGLAMAYMPLAMSMTNHHLRPALERRQAARAGDGDTEFAGDPSDPLDAFDAFDAGQPAA